MCVAYIDICCLHCCFGCYCYFVLLFVVCEYYFPISVALCFVPDAYCPVTWAGHAQYGSPSNKFPYSCSVLLPVLDRVVCAVAFRSVMYCLYRVYPCYIVYVVVCIVLCVVVLKLLVSLLCLALH